MYTIRPTRRRALVGIALAATVLSTLAPISSAPAATQTADEGTFQPIGSFGGYRVDGVRDGMHEGARVRFVDMTIHNRSDQTTFPETIQSVWWQGRNTGEKVDARRRDLSRFGMYDYVKPGAMVAVTYIIPVRDDIDGIRVDYMKAPKGEQERRWTWYELIGGAPGTLYHKGRPVAMPMAAASVPAPAAPASTAPVAEPAQARPAAQASRRAPDLSKVTGAIDELTEGRTILPKKTLRGLLGAKLKSLTF
jgi:hypothetical protein